MQQKHPRINFQGVFNMGWIMGFEPIKKIVKIIAAVEENIFRFEKRF